MDAKRIRAALLRERLLMRTYEPAGAVYSQRRARVQQVGRSTHQSSAIARRPVLVAERGWIVSWLHPDVARGKMTRALTSAAATREQTMVALLPYCFQ